MSNKEYCRTYYKKNKEKMLQSRREKVVCAECGDTVNRSSMNYHLKTKLHKKRTALMKERKQKEVSTDVDRILELYKLHNGNKEKILSSLIT